MTDDFETQYLRAWLGRFFSEAQLTYLIARRLLPDWRYWQEPKTLLPIDEEIIRLWRSNHDPRLLSRKELADRGILCPFLHARWRIALGVHAAGIEAADDPAARAQAFEEIRDAARSAAPGIAKLGKLLLTRPSPLWPVVEAERIRTIYKLIYALDQLNGLDQVADYANVERHIFRRELGHVGRRVFAAEMGRFWRDLTGSTPARTEPFIRFVASAHASLGDNMTEVSWDRAVRSMLAMGIDWSR